MAALGSIMLLVQTILQKMYYCLLIYGFLINIWKDLMYILHRNFLISWPFTSLVESH